MIDVKKIIYLLLFIFHYSLFAFSPSVLIDNGEKFEDFNNFMIGQGHDDIVIFVVFPPNGRYIISGLWDNTLIFFQYMQIVIFVYTLYCVRQKYQKKHR